MNDTYTHTPRERRPARGRRAVTLVAVLVTAGAVATAAFGMNHNGGFGGPMARITKKLDLSDTQQEKIEAILSASRSEAAPLREDMQTMRTELQTLVKSDVFYEDQVRAKVGAHSETMIELAVLGARTMHAVRAELTPEQQAEAEAMLERFAEGGPRKHGGHKRNRDD